MNRFFKTILAGGAKKLGGGCFGTVLLHFIYWILGYLI
jgi:hypothetical protein